MTTPGFNPGAVRFRPLPSQQTQRSSGPAPSPAQQGQGTPAGGRSRQNAVQTGSVELLKPILFIAIANVLALVALFGVLSIVLSPLGIVAGVQGVKFGIRGVKMMLGRA